MHFPFHTFLNIHFKSRIYVKQTYKLWCCCLLSSTLMHWENPNLATSVWIFQWISQIFYLKFKLQTFHWNNTLVCVSWVFSLLSRDKNIANIYLNLFLSPSGTLSIVNWRLRCMKVHSLPRKKGKSSSDYFLFTFI